MNYSSDPEQEYAEHLFFILRMFRITSYSVTFILGIVGNLLVIWITGFKLKCISATWFLHLAVTDLILCNIALPLRMAEWIMISEDWFDGKDLCTFSTSLIFFNMLTSVYFLTIISIDRCVSVIWPIRSKIHRTPRLAKIISGIVWTVCLMITVPYVIIFHFVYEVSDCNSKLSQHKYIDDTSFSPVILIPKLVIMFAVPFLIISISNGLVAHKLKALRRPVRSQKPLKVITVVIFFFFVCWCPYGSWPLIPINIEYWKTDFIIHEICVCLAYFNSCINPILYVAFSQDFRSNSTLRSLPARLKVVLEDRDETSGETPSIELCTLPL
uniref:G-protein coupled receptors family 1 profile domain-containing protein n=1 Tax=Leptobrachium leishanense TaxID=445787 RepID=A0A8C5Q9Q7_9ANUR